MGFGCWASGSASALRAEIRTRLALERRVKAFMREHHMVFGGFLQQSSREGSGAIALPSCGWGSCKFCFPCGVCRRFPFEHALIFFSQVFSDIWFWVTQVPKSPSLPPQHRRHRRRRSRLFWLQQEVRGFGRYLEELRQLGRVRVRKWLKHGLVLMYNLIDKQW
jgi:hypothetical protein